MAPFPFEGVVGGQRLPNRTSSRSLMGVVSAMVSEHRFDSVKHGTIFAS
jgi:hypothetical protein